MSTLSQWPKPFGIISSIILAAGVLSLACDRDQVTRSAAPPATAPMPSAPPMGGPGMQGDVPMPPAPRAPLSWTLPKGWTATPGSGMRFATLNLPGNLEVSVVVLGGSAGGELANVNRWRGQINLPPLDEAGMAAAKKTVKSKAGLTSVFDFTSEGQVRTRMLASALTTADGSTWFFKLRGDEASVAKARPDYLRFLETLHLD